MSGSIPPAEAVLRRLEWTVIRRLDGALHGDYRTLFRGYGLDLADLREYQYQDDVRHIDWNVTARLQTPYVREFNEERELCAWFLLDFQPVGRLRFAAGAASAPCRLSSSPCWPACSRAMATAPARSSTASASTRCCRRRTAAATCCGCCTSCSARPELPRSGATDLGGLPAHGVCADPPPLAGVRPVRLHQHAGLGRVALPSCAAPRGDRGAAASTRSRWSCPTSGWC